MFLHKRKYMTLLPIFVLTLFMTMGCDKEDNPVTPHEEHNEAEGMVLKINNANIVVVKEGKVESGKISVKAGENTAEITTRFLHHDGSEFTPDEAGSSLALEIANATVASAAVVSGKEWNFKVSGIKAGTTILIVKLMHNDHADFTTPGISVEITN